jgi:hypothetical protein
MIAIADRHVGSTEWKKVGAEVVDAMPVTKPTLTNLPHPTG